MRRHADHPHRGVTNGDASAGNVQTSSPRAPGKKRSRGWSSTATTTKLGHPGWDGGRRSESNKLSSRIVALYCFVGGVLLFVVHILLFRTAINSPEHNKHLGNHESDNEKEASNATLDTSSEHEGMDEQSLAMYEEQLAQAMDRGLTELGPIDREQYTIRINTWRRNEQLLVSLNHHSKCEGLAQIQVVWCDSENEPPEEILNHPSGKVVVERHTVNSLNERFNILSENTPTLGILSMDDDVLRSCDAIDAGFFRWVSHPDRLVGYDARLHMPDMKTKRFSYGYKSSTEKYNRYSITLPRYCFVHRDYLDYYIEYLPQPILDRVEEKFECEDIALSFFVSALTDGDPPLLADFWATKVLVKLYSPAAISGTSGHKTVRDQCIEDFLTMLRLRDGLKAKLLVHELWHEDNIMFGFGAEPDPELFRPGKGMVTRHISLAERVQSWMGLSKEDMTKKVINEMVLDTAKEAKSVGLLDGTPEWKARWKRK